MKIEVNPHVPRDLTFENQLRDIFAKKHSELLLKAVMDETSMRNLRFYIGENSCIAKSRGEQVNYCKKTRRFNFIQYTINGYAKQFEI